MADAGSKPDSGKWRPSGSDKIAVGALLAGVVMWVVPPGWQIGAPVAALVIIAVIFTAARDRAHPLIRSGAAIIVIAIFLGLVGPPLWASFHKDHPRVAFNWPITLNPPAAPPPVPQEPPDMPPLNLPGPLLSKAGKAMFFCDLPAPSSVPPPNFEEVIAEIRRNADIVGNATGLSIVPNQIPYGFRMDVTANAPEGQLRMAGLQRFTIQIERASKGLFITTSLDYGALGILGWLLIEPNSDMAKTWAKIVEQFTGLPQSKCRLL